MPGAVAMREQRPRQARREVAMDEADAGLADEPRLELREVGVVAPRDMVEEGHCRGDSIASHR